MKHLVIFFSILSIFLFSSFNDIKNILFENDKVIIYVKDKGVRLNYQFKNFKENEKYKIEYYVFPNSPKFIGSEKLTTNKELIDKYIENYRFIAFKDYYKVEGAVFNKKLFKIETEIKNNLINFYYYHSNVNGYEEVINSGDLNRKKDVSFVYLSYNNFFIEIYSNDEFVLSKEINIMEN